MKMTISVQEETAKRLREAKERTGIPMSKIVERSFVQSDFYDEEQN